VRYPVLAVSAGNARPPFSIDLAQVRQDPVADLAVYFLADDYPESADVAFWPEEWIETDSTRSATDYLFLHGYPGQQSYSSQSLNSVVSRSLPYGAMQRLRDEGFPVGVDDLYQFAVNFDDSATRIDGPMTGNGVPDPHGLSGSPVWRIGASGHPAKDWSPERAKLVGVLTQWRPTDRVLVATRASRLLDLVALATSS
jgi:hypothetical protein